MYYVFQCTEETKIRQFLDIEWVRASAERCPWPCLSSAVGCNPETAGRLSRRSPPARQGQLKEPVFQNFSAYLTSFLKFSLQASLVITNI